MNLKTSRREFLSAGLALPVVGAGSKMGLLSAPRNEEPAAPGFKLEHRTLGRTGLKVSTVSFGCGFTLDPSVIERAVDMGINYYDTARAYVNGNSERAVGAALGERRKQVLLSTKSLANDKKGLLKDLDTSLRELNTDFVDIWYLHDKRAPADVRDEMIEAMQTARQQGKTRFLGISVHTNQQQMLPWMAQKGVFDVVLAAYNFTMDPSVGQAIDAAAKAGVGVVAMKVMAGGPRFLKPGDPILRTLARPGAMLAALTWAIQRPTVATAVPSMLDMDQLEENAGAMGKPLTAVDQKVLAAHLEEIRPAYCHMCGDCAGTCQMGLPVADVLRFLTYADGYGQFATGREAFLKLPADHQAVRCGDCESCTVECPHGVHVARRMARAQQLFA